MRAPLECSSALEWICARSPSPVLLGPGIPCQTDRRTRARRLNGITVFIRLAGCTYPVTVPTLGVCHHTSRFTKKAFLLMTMPKLVAAAQSTARKQAPEDAATPAPSAPAPGGGSGDPRDAVAEELMRSSADPLPVAAGEWQGAEHTSDDPSAPAPGGAAGGSTN